MRAAEDCQSTCRGGSVGKKESGVLGDEGWPAITFPNSDSACFSGLGTPMESLCEGQCKYQCVKRHMSSGLERQNGNSYLTNAGTTLAG